MIIDKTNEFIFFHNPKCAGTLMTGWLSKSNNVIKFWKVPIYNKVPDLGHLNQQNWKEYVSPEYHHFKKICIVRNPYTRFVSGFNQTQKIKTGQLYFKNNNIVTIDDFMKHILSNPNEIYNMNIPWLHPQHIFTHFEDKCMIDYLIYFENLDEQINILEKKYILPKRNFNFDDNKNKEINKLKVINKDVINFVNKIYEKDFDLFNFIKIYKFYS